MANKLCRRCAGVVGLLMAVVLFGCSYTPLSCEQARERERAARVPAVTEGLKEAGTLTVGIRRSEGAPFVLRAGAAVQGLDIDIACSLADELGLDATFVYVDDADAVQDSCDVVMGAPGDPGDAASVLGTYAQSATALFKRGEAGVVPAAEIAGARIAVQEGSPSQQMLRITTLDVEEQAIDDLSRAFHSLAAGSCDYVLCQATLGAYLCTWHAGLSFAGTFNDPVQVAVAMPAGEGSLQDALRAAWASLEANGVLAEARRSWLGDLGTLDASSRVSDIPLVETKGVSLDALASSFDEYSAGRDGSTAGANAVILEESVQLGNAANDAATDETAVW